MKRLSINFILFSAVLFFTACATGPKLSIDSYSTPEDIDVLSNIEINYAYIPKNSYLVMWLNPKVKLYDGANGLISPMILKTLKDELEKSTFITVDPSGDFDPVTLNIVVSEYNYDKTIDMTQIKSDEKNNESSLELEMSFIISKGGEDLLIRTYSDEKTYKTSNPMGIVNDIALADELSKKMIKKFISDITPQKTETQKQFKPFPEELMHITKLVKEKNYTKAVKDMSNYHGQKDMDYYYNLALLYEARASESGNLMLLSMAKVNYERSFKLGGDDDSLIEDAYEEFITLYELLHKTRK